MFIADSYNFSGLFYMSMDSIRAAIKNFKRALAIIPQPPYKPLYQAFSYPYHITGNLAEAFLKALEYDSAAKYARLSFTQAEDVNRPRGKAIAIAISPVQQGTAKSTRLSHQGNAPLPRGTARISRIHADPRSNQAEAVGTHHADIVGASDIDNFILQGLATPAGLGKPA